MSIAESNSEIVNDSNTEVTSNTQTATNAQTTSNTEATRESNIDITNENIIVKEIEPVDSDDITDKLLKFIKKNAFIIIFVIVLLCYIFLFSSLGNKMTPNNNSSVTESLSSVSESVKSTTGETNDSKGKYFLELLLWSVFVLLLLLNGVLYIFNVDVITSVKNLFGNIPQVEIVVDTDGVKKIKKVKPKEVYHIPDNLYDYESAKAICKARGSRLATYQELSDAYDKGADWCGYGWSDGQMALFPTQSEKWEKLQDIEGHENDCGRPGINGGYIANPDVRYGINCYGYKENITSEEALLMAETPLYPRTQKEMDFNNKVDYWKTKIPDILLAPFNHNNWSIF
jgi:hypothetical protein